VASNRRAGLAAVVLLVVGVGLMVIPPLARDGICGFVSCADQVPDIAVTRTSPTTFAIVVPEESAPSVRSVQLLEGGSRATGSRRWFIQRDGSDVHRTFPAGSEPSGFRTVTPLEVVPVDGTWTAQVGFRCTTASLPFRPDGIAVGEVRSWVGVVSGSSFSSTARTEEQCGTSAGGAERGLLVVGALLATVGAVLGIVVVLRRPVRFPEDDDDRDGDGGEPDQAAGSAAP
jgi:hypothetical protein